MTNASLESLLNGQTRLVHDCWVDECDGQIEVTLKQYAVNYYVSCPKPECRKPVVYGGNGGENYLQHLVRLTIAGLAKKGWKVVS